MLKSYIKPGQRVEIQVLENGLTEKQDGQKSKMYASKVHDTLSPDRFEIVMPMEKAKLILLPVDEEYSICFYTEQGPYQCFARIVDRYKSDNIYLLVVELTSNLQKIQRREFYRYSCALDMKVRPILPEEIIGKEPEEYRLIPGLPFKEAVIVEISGGGLRFVCREVFEVDSVVLCTYYLQGSAGKRYEVLARILKAKELEMRPGKYQYRVQYVDINNEDREDIVKYIFEEERKFRQKELGM